MLDNLDGVSIFRIFPPVSQAEIDFEHRCAELMALTNIDRNTAATILRNVLADDLCFWIAMGYTIAQAIVLIDCNVSRYRHPLTRKYADPVRANWKLPLKDNRGD